MSNSFLFVNATEIYQFKAKVSEMERYPLCLGNISGNFSANNMKKKEEKTGSNGCCTIFLLIIDLLMLVTLSISVSI